MTLPRSIDTYGGIFVDAEPVGVAVQEQAAAYQNRLGEDAAQMTRTAVKAWVTFTPTATAAPTTVTATDGRIHGGTGSGLLPTISKTSNGCYTITYAASFTDGLGETEGISFVCGMPHAWGAGITGHARLATIVGNVVTIEVRDESAVFSNLGGTGNVTLFLW